MPSKHKRILNNSKEQHQVPKLIIKLVCFLMFFSYFCVVVIWFKSFKSLAIFKEFEYVI